MRTIFVIAIAALAFSSQAHAQRLSNLTGQKLVQLCASNDRGLMEGCTAYIDGIADSAAFYQRLRPSDASKGAVLPGYICVPTATTGVQLRQTVIEWLRKHQDQAGRQASGVVLRALDESFVCPGEQRRMAPGE